MKKKRDMHSAGVWLPRDLSERAQNAAFWVGRGLSLSALLVLGLEHVTSELEKKHNEGKPFRQRDSREKL